MLFLREKQNDLNGRLECVGKGGFTRYLTLTF